MENVTPVITPMKVSLKLSKFDSREVLMLPFMDDLLAVSCT